MMDILSIVTDFVLGGIFLTVIFVYYTRGKSYFAHMHLSIAVKNINIRTARGSNCFQKKWKCNSNQNFKNSTQFLKYPVNNILNVTKII